MNIEGNVLETYLEFYDELKLVSCTECGDNVGLQCVNCDYVCWECEDRKMKIVSEDRTWEDLIDFHSRFS